MTIFNIYLLYFILFDIFFTMTLDQRIWKLREWIESMPSMSDMIEAMRAWNRERADEIVWIEKKLKWDFKNVFAEFKSALWNAEKLKIYARVLRDIRPWLWEDVAERVVFLLYVNNSVQWVNMVFAEAWSINFGQYISEYVDWSKFREYFWDSDISPEFFETEWHDVRVYTGDRDQHMQEVFLAMKDRFQFTD